MLSKYAHIQQTGIIYTSQSSTRNSSNVLLTSLEDKEKESNDLQATVNTCNTDTTRPVIYTGREFQTNSFNT